MWEIEKGKSNLVFEVVRKDSYSLLSRMVEDMKIPGMVVSVHENRYLRKLSDNNRVQMFVVYTDKTEFIDPRVLRDRTMMLIQDFLSNNDNGIMLLDVMEELGKRLSPQEMVKTVETIVSFKSCRHTVLVTLNPIVLPRDVVKEISSLFDAIQDVRAASLGGEHLECPGCGAQWDPLVTMCSMCGYNIKSNTIRVSTSTDLSTNAPRPHYEAPAPDAPLAPISPAKASSGKRAKRDAGEKHVGPVSPAADVVGDEGGTTERQEGKDEFMENLTFKFLSLESKNEKAPEKNISPLPSSTPKVDWFSRGVSLELKGDSRGALDAYEKAIEHSPNDPWLYLNKGVSLQRLGDLARALECYDRSIELEPSDPDAWSNRATALRGLGRLEEAVESYRKALELNPGDGGIWSNMGIALRSMGRYEEALDSYESALRISPMDVSIWLNKAAVLNSMSQLEKAMECYDHILSIDPDNLGVKELKRFLRRRMANVVG